jgi:hypothetical protein
LLAVRRGLWLLAVAYGFRLAEFLVGGGFLRATGVQELLRVDILNVIGVGLVLSAALAALGRRGRTGALLAGIAAAAIVLATPLVADVLRHYDLPRAGQPVDPAARAASGPLVDLGLAYLSGSFPRANFSLFNWAAFLLAGAALGPLASGPNRPLRWVALGCALFGGGWLADQLPAVFPYNPFWKTSPAWFLMRLGVCVALAGALQALPAAAERGLRWLSTLGRQSLVAYLASVELTYGLLAHPIRKRLSLGTTALGMVAMIALTWLIVDRWERWRARRARGPTPGSDAGHPRRAA